MSSITKYVLVDRSNTEGDHEYDLFDEAKQAAGDTHAVAERTYTYDDTALMWTPDGSGQWPPKPGAMTQEQYDKRMSDLYARYDRLIEAHPEREGILEAQLSREVDAIDAAFMNGTPIEPVSHD